MRNDDDFNLHLWKMKRKREEKTREKKRERETRREMMIFLKSLESTSR